MITVRVELPAHLRTLAGVGREIELKVPEGATQKDLVDALEARYPMLRGTVRDQASGQRRAFLRFFACEEDLSHAGLAAQLPTPVLQGDEAFLVVGAVAGG